VAEGNDPDMDNTMNTSAAEETSVDHSRAFQETEPLYILHLSDLHFGTAQQATGYCVDLRMDIKEKLKTTYSLDIPKLHYLVISGDIAQKAAKQEYAAANIFVKKLSEEFSIPKDHVVVVPGNHDVNWELTERNEEGRFLTYDSEFRRNYRAADYPLKAAEQYDIFWYKDENPRVVFLGLNSACKIDRHHPNDSRLHDVALAGAREAVLHAKDHDTYLKLAVVHHRDTGENSTLETDLLNALAVFGVQIILHGHAHKTSGWLYKHEIHYKVHIVGAGMFGESAEGPRGNHPYQYNLLALDRQKGEVCIYHRRKPQARGPWCGDAVYGEITRFSVNLPSVPTKDASRERKVLLADNDADYRRAARVHLETSGHVVEEAESPAQAKSVLSSTSIAVLLVDLRLVKDSDDYDFSGLDVATRAQELGIPSIIMTNYPSVDTVRQALRSVHSAPIAVDYVLKKDSFQTIVDVVDRILAGRVVGG